MPTKNLTPHPKGRCDRCDVARAIGDGDLSGVAYEDTPCARCVARHAPHDLDLYREVATVDYAKADAAGALASEARSFEDQAADMLEPEIVTVDLGTPTVSMVDFFAAAMALPDDARDLVVFVMRYRGRGAFAAWARGRGFSREYARKVYRAAQEKVPALAMIYRRHQKTK